MRIIRLIASIGPLPPLGKIRASRTASDSRGRQEGARRPGAVGVAAAHRQDGMGHRGAVAVLWRASFAAIAGDCRTKRGSEDTAIRS